MCKSRADGGERCNHHSVKATSAAMTTYVVLASGVDRAEATRHLSDLRAEFADAPAPAREEVDEFLRHQEFQVRHDPTIPEKPKQSILSRIRSAIGKALPDGATFASWKNLMARVWQRSKTPLKVAGAVAAAGAVGVLLIAGAQNTGAQSDAYNHNIDVALSQKYHAVEKQSLSKYTQEYKIDGTTQECTVSNVDSHNNYHVTDVNLDCVDAHGNWHEAPVLGKVSDAGQHAVQRSTLNKHIDDLFTF